MSPLMVTFLPREVVVQCDERRKTYLRLTDAITTRHLRGLSFWLRRVAPRGASVDRRATVPHR